MDAPASTVSPVPPTFRYFNMTRLVAVGTIVSGLYILAAWMRSDETIVMKFNTGVGLLFLGGALSLTGLPGRGFQIVSSILLTVPLVLGALTLFEYSSDADLGVDQLFWRDNFNSDIPGRMSMAGSILFALLSFALFILLWDLRPVAAQMLAVLAGLISYLALLCHIYDIPFLYQRHIHGTRSPYAAVGFLLLSVGILYVRPNQGVMQTLTSSAPGGVLARRLLPASAAAVLLLGLLRQLGFGLGWISLDQGLALALLCLGLTIVALIWFNALLLNRAHALNLGTEHERQESELRFKHLADSNMLGIFFYDFTGAIYEANDYFLNTLGYTHEDVAAKRLNWKALTPPEGAEECRIKVAELRATGFVSYEKEYFHKDGSRIPVMVGGVTFESAPERGIAFMLDLSALKRAELDAGQRALELVRSNQDLEQFAYVASHDLQEPLRMVASFTRLLQKRYKDKLDADANEYIHYAVDGAQRMQQLIADLLEYSRVSTRKRTFARLPLDSALDQALSNLRAPVLETGVVIERQKLPEASGDLTQLTQLFQNLIGNALKYKGVEIPHVRIGAVERNGERQFYVADNGIGIKPEYHERVFVIFQRLHSKGDYPGTGIGLALCKKIVERHGGRIWVESDGHSGSTFYFTLNSSGTLDNSFSIGDSGPYRISTRQIPIAELKS